MENGLPTFLGVAGTKRDSLAVDIGNKNLGLLTNPHLGHLQSLIMGHLPACLLVLRIKRYLVHPYC